jgi:phosphoribosyl 1,2-cyclic phosphate phosphodiesterase
MLGTGIKQLDAVLFTHEHKDHTAGLDDVRAFNHVMQRPIDVYAEKRVQNSIKQEFAYVFSKVKYPGVPELKFHTIDEMPFYVDGVQIIPIRVMHMHLPILGFRIGNFAYITDANKLPENESNKLKDLDSLIINALRKKPHISHFTLDETLLIIKQLKPKYAYITHISHQMGFHEKVQSELPKNVFLAYDGLIVEEGK